MHSKWGGDWGRGIPWGCMWLQSGGKKVPCIQPNS